MPYSQLVYKRSWHIIQSSERRCSEICINLVLSLSYHRFVIFSLECVNSGESLFWIQRSFLKSQMRHTASDIIIVYSLCLLFFGLPFPAASLHLEFLLYSSVYRTLCPRRGHAISTSFSAIPSLQVPTPLSVLWLCSGIGCVRLIWCPHRFGMRLFLHILVFVSTTFQQRVPCIAFQMKSEVVLSVALFLVSATLFRCVCFSGGWVQGIQYFLSIFSRCFSIALGVAECDVSIRVYLCYTF